MSGEDFAFWVSRLCVLYESGSDAEFADKLRSFAAECEVEVSDDDLREWFRLDDGTLEMEGRKS